MIDQNKAIGSYQDGARAQDGLCIFCGQEISPLANGSTICASAANISEPDTVGNRHHVTLAFRDLNKESERVRQMMRDGDTEGLAAYANAGNRSKASEIIRKRYAITPERIAEAKAEVAKDDRHEFCNCLHTRRNHASNGTGHCMFYDGMPCPCSEFLLPRYRSQR